MEATQSTLSKIRSSFKECISQILTDDKNSSSVPVSKLSSANCSLVKTSWDLMLSSSSESEFGKRLLIRFLEVYPEHRTFFETMLQGDDQNESNSALNRHAVKVMNALSAVVENLHRPESLMDIIQRTARSHLRMGVGPSQFKELFAVLVDTIKDELGVRFSNEMEGAWTAALSFMLNIISEEMTELDGTHS